LPIEPIGPFLGMNTSLPPTQLEQFDRGRRSGDFMRSLDNVDVTDAGTVRTRQGWVQKIGGIAVRSLYGLPDGTALAADYDKLYRLAFDGRELTRTEVLSGINPGAKVSYADAPDGVYLSDGFALWRCQGGEVRQASLPHPNFSPDVSASAGGSLPAGLYQVVATYQGADGRESGATQSVQVDVPEHGMLQVQVPGSLPDAVAQVNVYVSACNGDVPYFVGAGSQSISLPPDGGGQCHTRHLRPMPGGQLVRYRNGRVLVALGSTLYVSEPFAHGLYDPVGGYFPFAGAIKVLEPVAGGVYVVADKTYFMPGDFEAVREVAPYGAAFDSSAKAPDGTLYWFSDRGIVLADDEGGVQPQHDSKVAVRPAQMAAVLVREQDGLQQVLAAPREGGGSGSLASAHGFMDAQVIRQGERDA